MIQALPTHMADGDWRGHSDRYNMRMITDRKEERYDGTH